MSRQEEQLDAAEYVIGTLSGVERAAFEVVLRSHPQAREDVQFWERTFGALNASVSPVAAPQNIWSQIEKNLPGAGEAISKRADAAASVTNLAPASGVIKAASSVANDNSTGLQKSRSRWRFTAIAASLLALGLGAYVLNDRFNILDMQSPETIQQAGLTGENYVAVVNANGDQPSLIVNIDAKTGEITVRSIGVKRPEGKSLEIWYVPAGQDAVSVGLVEDEALDIGKLKAAKGDLLAISVEPVGGSPTGTATGPIIYTGKLVEDTTAK